MRLSLLNEGLHPDDVIGKWVHIRVPFLVQWSALSRCKKGDKIEPFNYGPMELAYVCDVLVDGPRPEAEMEGNCTVTCFFPTVLGGKGAIGSQTANSLDLLVKIYK